MINKSLIEYLQSCWETLEESGKYESEDFKGLGYLYFATLQEQFSIHRIEKLRGGNLSNPFAIKFTFTQKFHQKILEFKPYFEEMLKIKNITSITSIPFPPKGEEELSKAVKLKFIKKIKKIEKNRGILNALLSLKNLAFFPKEKTVGSKITQRLAACYLKHVVSVIENVLREDKEIESFLDWLRKRTVKIFSWRFKKKELRSPPPSSISIYKDEAASYVRYFLEQACKSTMTQQFAEMVVFISLCQACARQHSYYFGVKDVLNVTKEAICNVQIPPKLPLGNPFRENPFKDIKKKSKGSHDVLLMGISEEFLADDTIWNGDDSLIVEHDVQDQISCCKMIRVKGRLVLISQRLAKALELLERFTISPKDVENNVRKAYQVVGLFQSSGGLSPKCFLAEPHFWEGIDTRKSHPKDVKRKSTISKYRKLKRVSSNVK